jgi:hypothetical protein
VTMGLLRRKPSTTGGVVFCLLVAVIPVLIVAFDLPKLSWPQVPATASDCTAHYRRKGNTQRVTDCRMTWSADGTTRSTVVEYPRNDVSDGMTVPTLVRGDDAVDLADRTGAAGHRGRADRRRGQITRSFPPSTGT